MNEPRSVRRMFTPVLALMVVLLVVTGGLGILSSVLSYRAVHHLTDEVQPAVAANAAVLQDLTDAETGVRAWALSGEADSLEPYRAGVERLPAHEAELRAYAEDHDDLTDLVAAQEEAARSWLEEYADPRVSRAGGPGTYRPGQFEAGRQRFEDLRRIHAEIERVLEDEVDQSRETAVKRVRRTGVALTLAVVLGLTLAVVAGRRLLREIRDPLEHLESVVLRMAAGEQDVRAVPGGPREARRVADALNALAAENERGRAVEAAVTAEVRALDAARGDFVSNVSHELRTPLTTIAGYLELVEDEFQGRLDPRHEQMLEAGQRNVTRLRTLIDDLLTLSRAENRSTDLEQLDLRRLLQDAADDLRLAARRREIHIETVLGADPVMVLADRGQLQRVLANLLSNAVKFSLVGGTVRGSVTLEGQRAVARVVDHGIGIPAQDQGSVGTRFFRASNAVAAEVPGTGLGLRIVQSIVDNHGGTLTLESVEGEGTTATVRLPVFAEREEAGREEAGRE